MRIMNYASGADIAAFNVGNALGAWLGGLPIAAGLGFTSPIWMGAVVTAGGLVVLLIATAMDRPTAEAPADSTLVKI